MTIKQIQQKYRHENQPAKMRFALGNPKGNGNRQCKVQNYAKNCQPRQNRQLKSNYSNTKKNQKNDF